MPQAKFQMEQNGVIAPDDSSYLAFTTTDGVITLTDTTPGTPISRTWVIASKPGPLSAAPALSSATAASTEFDPSGSDGMYLVTLTRRDSSGTSTRTLVVGVGDMNGFVLPSPGVAGHHLPVGATAEAQALAMAAGYVGSDEAGTHVLLDAYLRSLSGGGGGPVTEAQLRTAAAALTATLNVNDRSISDCTGVYAPTGNSVGFFAGTAFVMVNPDDAGISVYVDVADAGISLTAVDGALTMSVGAAWTIQRSVGAAYSIESASGVNHRTQWHDAGSALGLTQDVDNAAVVLTAVGTYSLRAGGNIALRPTGDTVDTLVCAVVSSECKLTSTKAIRVSSSSNAILEGTGAYLTASSAVLISSGTTTTISSTGQLVCSTGSNAHFYNGSSGLYNYAVNGLLELKGYDTLCTLTDAGSIETVKRTNSGYCGQWERRYFYGELTAAAASALTGSFTPSISDGVVRVVSNVVARRTVGGTGGFGITTTATFTVAAGVVSQVASYTELAPAEETAAGTGVYHDNSTSQIRLVAIGIASETWRFESYTEVFYAAAA